MTKQEALNVAWHVRVNGLRDVAQQTLIDAVAALEQQGETLKRVEALPAAWRERFGLLMHDERIRLAKENCARDLEHALQVKP
jgi:hypothetical protein